MWGLLRAGRTPDARRRGGEERTKQEDMGIPLGPACACFSSLCPRGTCSPEHGPPCPVQHTAPHRTGIGGLGASKHRSSNHNAGTRTHPGGCTTSTARTVQYCHTITMLQDHSHTAKWTLAQKALLTVLLEPTISSSLPAWHSPRCGLSRACPCSLPFSGLTPGAPEAPSAAGLPVCSATERIEGAPEAPALAPGPAVGTLESTEDCKLLYCTALSSVDCTPACTVAWDVVCGVGYAAAGGFVCGLECGCCPPCAEALRLGEGAACGAVNGAGSAGSPMSWRRAA